MVHFLLWCIFIVMEYFYGGGAFFYCVGNGVAAWGMSVLEYGIGF